MYPVAGSGVVLGLAVGSAVGGAVGGGIAGAATGDVEAPEFNGSLKTMSVQMGAEVRAAITKALRNDGYDVNENVVPRFGANLLSRYDDVKTNSDAILDATVVAAYAGEGGWFSPTLSPMVLIYVRLVDTKNHSTLFNKGYLYNSTSKTLRADERYTVPNEQALLSDPQLAVEAWRAGAARIADQIQQDLAK